jgi:Domain of unknown function (DUF4202)
MQSPDFERAISLIDAAHAQDPNKVPRSLTDKFKSSSSTFSATLPITAPSSQAPNPDPDPSPVSLIPYELHYANKMTSYLHLHAPHPSPLLSLAVRAQHLRRWEIPRSSYPEGKAGYFAWRTFLKKRQGQQAREICLECGFSTEEADRVAALIAKEGLKKGDGLGDDEVQILEDVACLVFLDDQFDEFERGHDEEKIVGILKKTWGKMGGRGRELALQIDMGGRAKELVDKALKG